MLMWQRLSKLSMLVEESPGQGTALVYGSWQSGHSGYQWTLVT